jgi:hypothetical protein
MPKTKAETPEQLARRLEKSAGQALYNALDENNPTAEEVRERIRLAGEYMAVASALWREIALTPAGKSSPEGQRRAGPFAIWYPPVQLNRTKLPRVGMVKVSVQPQALVNILGKR